MSSFNPPTNYFIRVSTPKGCLEELQRLLGRKAKLAPAPSTLSARMRATLGYSVMGLHSRNGYYGTPEGRIRTIDEIMDGNPRPLCAPPTDYTPAKNTVWLTYHWNQVDAKQLDLLR